MADLDSIEAQITALDDRLDGINDRLDGIVDSIGAARDISRICPLCLGDGYITETNNSPQNPEYEETQVECPACAGETKINWAVREELS